jgi:ribosome biogenesis protein ERB1
VRKRLNVSNVESLLPKLPDPRELRPFPTTAAVTYTGHHGRVRCVGVSPDGQWVATGGDDGCLRVYELQTGRLMRCWRFADVEEAKGVVDELLKTLAELTLVPSLER